jgi:hypothetical protein
MQRTNYCLVVLVLATCVTVLTGCSGGKATLDTQYVEGVVTVDDKPVEGATVTFVPVNEGQGMSATGTTDANGVYKLTATVTGDQEAEPGAGTLPGDYYVGVIKTEFASVVSEEEAEEQGVEYEGGPEPGADEDMTFVVPQKYNIPKDSGLQVTVSEGDNDIPLKLTTTE